jgi:methylenetetrahydrofolate--tRNA-(uracil-5-)-methyltransferase
MRDEVTKPAIHVLGAGLAGGEAVWQIAQAGLDSILHEMRPLVPTPAHETAGFAELVCSNSLKSDAEGSAPWLLKEELRRLGSLLMDVASRTRVPGGNALTVDREAFSAEVTRALESHPRITVERGEVTRIPEDALVVVATGPLTSDALAEDIMRRTGSARLAFFDAISPIVSAYSVDLSIAFAASRYDKSLDGAASADYLNCPFTRDEYETFIDALLSAEPAVAHIQEDLQARFFEGCLPIEELARRGRDTLRFGPLKPVGLTDPRTGRWPYAAVQLRREDARGGSYNLVGFQNYMTFPEQRRVLRLIPGLQNAEFTRLGQIHRNTYINAPALLEPTLQLKSEPRILFAGQISGVEGYIEAIATGLLAGRAAVRLARGEEPRIPPRETALGSLVHYLTHADPKHYQPANIAFDLLPEPDEEMRKKFRRDKRARHAETCRRALEALPAYE